MDYLEYYGLTRYFSLIRGSSPRPIWSELSLGEYKFWKEYVYKREYLKNLSPGMFIGSDLIKEIDGFFWGWRKHEDAVNQSIQEDYYEMNEQEIKEWKIECERHWTQYKKFKNDYLSL